MSCKKMRWLFQAYLDKELSREEKERVENHLRNCESCRLDFSSLKSLIERLERVEVDTLSPSSGFTEKVISLLSERRPGFLGNFREILSLRPSWRSLVVISVILIVTITSLFLFLQKRSPSLVVVQFNFKAPQAGSVALVGDFNDWDKGVYLLSDDDKDGIWTTKITLKPGHYQYLFIVNGKELVADPDAGKYISDGFGGRNSLLIVRRG